jgi:outer membrane protein insertion porin family
MTSFQVRRPGAALLAGTMLSGVPAMAQTASAPAQGAGNDARDRRTGGNRAPTATPA